MAWKRQASFTGGSGQMAVIGELLHRKCNAAIPHVDVGTDVFAFRDDREDVARIQVKTALGTWHKHGRGYRARFGVPMAQLGRTDEPPLFYVFAVRVGNAWGNFIVVSRARLKELWDEGCGSENPKSGNLELGLEFRVGNEAAKTGDPGHESQAAFEACCGRFDLSDYLNAWESLPPLKPLEGIDPGLAQA